VWFTPTLVSWRGRTLDRDAVARLAGIHYISPALEQRWEPPDPLPGAVELELLSGFGPLAASAHRAGVHLLAGSDAGDPNVVPGFALHDELQLLVEAGVPPLEAIRAATLEPARALGVEQTVGSIERTKAADVVLLGADPLADIRNTRRIVAVVVNGRLLTAAQLAALIEPLRRPRESPTEPRAASVPR
jgi:imidazolonepropionase-like amidohydrolase